MANALSSETSRYLLAHKDQPVQWQAWNEAALAQARQQNKPILLSIGYSTNHWCHAMARESFSDAHVAELMNDYFVNIKVDREERPDLDEIYQTMHQLITGKAGGWPLTIFLCPRTRLPFIAGTYYHKNSHDDQLGFIDLVQRVHDFYQDFSTNFTVLRDQVEKGVSHLQAAVMSEGKVKFSLSPIKRGAKLLLKQADKDAGGFGGAPKFPMVSRLETLYDLANSEYACSADAEKHLAKTLTAMALGGIADPVSGGFFRYSTDAQWQIPNFEKMLNDNGQLLQIYAKGWSHFQDPLYATTAAHIASWALSEIRSPEGAFYSAVDADFHGICGAYYVFSEQQLHRVLNPQQFVVMSAMCGWENTPNYEGHWHLHRERSCAETAELLSITLQQCNDLYRQGCAALKALRNRQPAPERDKKIKVSWNALMIRGLVAASRYLPEDDELPVTRAECLAAAQQAMDFIRESLWINGRLFATWQCGQPKLSGYLDDYVYLIAAIQDLLQLEWRDNDYRFLIGLAESLQKNFEDNERGGFYFTAHDHEKLIYRPKIWADSVVPSANGMAADAFYRLGQLAGEPRYSELGLRTLEAGWHELERQPEVHGSLMRALNNPVLPPVQVLLYGDISMHQWQQAITEQYAEIVHCFLIPLNVEFCPPAVFGLEPNTALVFVGDHCLPEQTSLDDLIELLIEYFSAENGVASVANV